MTELNNTPELEDSTKPAIDYSTCYSQPLLVSFSGGRTSAFMTKLLIEMPKYQNGNLLIVYANTGKENEATLEFVNECDKRWNLGVVWLEADVNPEKGKGTNYKIVDFKTASRKGEPFEDVISKYGLPSKLYRHCTRELKEVPIHKFARMYFKGVKNGFLAAQVYDWLENNADIDDLILSRIQNPELHKPANYLTAIGIRADEKHRIGSKPNYIYPLAEMGFTEEIIRNWWDKQDFDLQLKDYEGNCDLCFLKSQRKKLTLISENPNITDWWDEMEGKYSSEYQEKFDMIRDKSIQELVEMAKEPFRKALDKHELNKQQGILFQAEMDVEYDCFCKMT
ncbi:MAG: phosphoadenosine phosphosulfate reductase family protein [Bacteroidales bacterium]|nr:phosphoadenosine phosphosulfate reductase family protein [Bacteroidales bacterium]